MMIVFGCKYAFIVFALLSFSSFYLSTTAVTEQLLTEHNHATFEHEKKHPLLLSVLYNGTSAASESESICFLHEKVCSTSKLTHLGQYIHNSVYMKHKLLKGKRNMIDTKSEDGSVKTEWHDFPMVISVIADERYIHSIDVFLESVLSFGYGLSDLLFVCTSIACSDHLVTKQVPHVLFRNTRCGIEPGPVDIRCAISDAKTYAVATLLRNGISMFMFDLDVYFKADPLSFELAPNVFLYAQSDEEDSPDNKLNFGVFLIRPHNMTVTLFEDITNQFRLTKTWDQQLFNALVISHNIPRVALPRNLNFRFGFDYPSFNASAMILVHMTCVEGAENKLLLARELFGPFASPKYYRQHRTLTWIYDGRGVPELSLVIGILKTIAKTTQRALRVANWDKYQLVLSLFSADSLLQDDHVDMVEEKYWTHAQQMYPELAANFTTKHFEISNYDDVQHLVNSHADAELSALQDISVRFVTVYMIDPFPWPNEEKHICQVTRHQKRAACLRTCQGHHF